VSAPKPATGQQPEGLISVGNTSAYLDLHHRYHDLVAELVPIANCSSWRTQEETCTALKNLVDRVLPPQQGKPTEPERDDDHGLDR
jgi:hypothetical protein